MAAGRKTGGRTKGTPNRKNAETVAKAQASGMLPHEFLCAVSQGQVIDGHLPSFEERLDAAKAAAPYYAPKLSSVEQTGKGGGPIQSETTHRFNLDGLTDDELEQLQRLSEKASSRAAVN